MPYQSLLIAFLADRDEPCPLCQYNLRGLLSPRCPECGQDLRLSVSLTEPYLKAWIAALVGLLLPAGFGVVLIVGFLYALSREGSHIFREFRFMPVGVAFMFGHAVACVPLGLAVLIFRRRFQCWPKASQQGAAGSVWIAVLISLLILLSNMMR